MIPLGTCPRRTRGAVDQQGFGSWKHTPVVAITTATCCRRGPCLPKEVIALVVFARASVSHTEKSENSRWQLASSM